MNIFYICMATVLGVLLGSLIAYFFGIRPMRKKIEEMEERHQLDTIHSDVD